MRRSLAARHIDVSPPKPLRLTERSVTFLATGPGIPHNDFMTQAWVRDPLTVVLSGIEGFRMPQQQPHGPVVQTPSAKATPPQRRNAARQTGREERAAVPPGLARCGRHRVGGVGASHLDVRFECELEANMSNFMKLNKPTRKGPQPSPPVTNAGGNGPRWVVLGVALIVAAGGSWAFMEFVWWNRLPPET